MSDAKEAASPVAVASPAGSDGDGGGEKAGSGGAGGAGGGASSAAKKKRLLARKSSIFDQLMLLRESHKMSRNKVYAEDSFFIFSKENPFRKGMNQSD